ncbi:MAG: hypothetical protein HYY23_20030 [Verrucomicrobia bacterium]|nr:hypothetical protein [Verrucomicrobiota bacterium]
MPRRPKWTLSDEFDRTKWSAKAPATAREARAISTPTEVTRRLASGSD